MRVPAGLCHRGPIPESERSCLLEVNTADRSAKPIGLKPPDGMDCWGIMGLTGRPPIAASGRALCGFAVIDCDGSATSEVQWDLSASVVRYMTLYYSIASEMKTNRTEAGNAVGNDSGRGHYVRLLAASMLLLAGGAAAQGQATRPDGLYAEIRTSKGTITARLEPDLTPLTVTNFVGLAEGTIANSAFDPGRPYFDGTVYHRVVPGHVIQAGAPKSDRARNPGYTFPNEIHARLSHNHAGALNMANSGPHTNASQFCIMLGDRAYLDGDYTVFGEVVEGMDVVMRIVQGDAIESIRIARIGTKAQAFRPTTESWRTMLRDAEQRVAEHAEKKRIAEREWIAQHYPKAEGPDGGVLTERLSAGRPTEAVTLRIRYRGSQVRYVGHVLGRDGPPIEVTAFGSGPNGVPGFVENPLVFTAEPGKTKINPGLDGVIAAMLPGERRIVIVPATLGYGRAGHYAPETAGQRRFVISPDTMLVYELERLANE